jgi:hypothetical protein
MKPSSDNSATRALSLAMRSTHILGIVSALFGLVMIVAFGYLNRYQKFGPYFITLGLVVWFAPGVVFVASAYLLKRRARAGAIAAMVMAMLQTLCAAAILVAVCTLPPVSPIPIIMTALWIAALGQLMLHLQRSLRAIRADTTATPGFALDAPQPVIPVHQSLDR